MRMRLKQRAREIWHRLLRSNANPHQIGAGFSLGVFISFLPIIPFRTLAALGLAWLLRQNVIAALAGKTITLLYSPLAPLLWLAEYELSRRFVFGEHARKFHAGHLGEILHMGGGVFIATLVGAVIIATPVSLVAYVLVRRLAEHELRRGRLGRS